jgi:hypothetical protein
MIHIFPSLHDVEEVEVVDIREFIKKTEHRAVQNTDKYSLSTERGRRKTLGGLTARRGE